WVLPRVARDRRSPKRARLLVGNLGRRCGGDPRYAAAAIVLATRAESMSARRTTGTFVLVGGGEVGAGCREFDADLLARAGADEVVVLPTAAAFEHPERLGARATAYFKDLGAKVRSLPILHRSEAEDAENAAIARAAGFVYVADGSPLHLRSVLKDSALFDALLASLHGGGVLAASGAGATVLCDPMVDPRGGAYTVGLGVVRNLAVFPYHATAADSRHRGRPPARTIHRPAPEDRDTRRYRRGNRARARTRRGVARRWRGARHGVRRSVIHRVHRGRRPRAHHGGHRHTVALSYAVL